MVPERQAWSSLYRPPPHSWPTAMPAAKKRGAERMIERSSPSWLTTLGRGSSACLTLLLPSLAWDEWIPRGKYAMLAFFLYFIQTRDGKDGEGEGKISLNLPFPSVQACWWALSCRWRAILSGIGERVRDEGSWRWGEPTGASEKTRGCGDWWLQQTLRNPSSHFPSAPLLFPQINTLVVSILDAVVSLFVG